MCHGRIIDNATWRQWVPVPTPVLSAADTPWQEISHILSEQLDIIPTLPAPRIRRVKSLPGDVANITKLEMVCHFGTHLDAPCHFIADGPAMDEIPLERLYGPGVVWALDLGSRPVIERADLESARPRVTPGDIVLLDTGTWLKMGTREYEDHASLSPEAAQWLVDQRVKMIGVDFSTPDLTAHRRPEDFDFPVHHILLSNGVLIAEHVTNLRELRNRRVDIMFMPLNIAGADGAPGRMLARQAAA